MLRRPAALPEPVVETPASLQEWRAAKKIAREQLGSRSFAKEAGSAARAADDTKTLAAAAPISDALWRWARATEVLGLLRAGKDPGAKEASKHYGRCGPPRFAFTPALPDRKGPLGNITMASGFNAQTRFALTLAAVARKGATALKSISRNSAEAGPQGSEEGNVKECCGARPSP